MTLPPPCLTHDAACFGSWAVSFSFCTLFFFPSSWYKLMVASSASQKVNKTRVKKLDFRAGVQGRFNQPTELEFLRVTGGLTSVNSLFRSYASPLRRLLAFIPSSGLPWSSAVFWWFLGSPALSCFLRINQTVDLATHTVITVSLVGLCCFFFSLTSVLTSFWTSV